MASLGQAAGQRKHFLSVLEIKIIAFRLLFFLSCLLFSNYFSDHI
jgi:hypothetical protein